MSERLFKGRLPGPGHGPAPTAVVEQGVDRLLEHPLLVVDDDLRSAQIEQPLEAVVPVDHPAVEVVQVRGGEAATVELDHGAQVGRDDGHGAQHHPGGRVDQPVVVVAAVEGRDDLEALDGLGLLLALAGGDGLAEELLLLTQTQAGDELLDGFGSHAAGEVLGVALLEVAPHPLVLHQLLGGEGAERVEDGLVVLDLGRGTVPALGDLLLRRLAQLVELGVLGPVGLQLLELLLELLEPAVDPQVALVLELLDLRAVLGLDGGQITVTALVVHPGDEVGGEVDDLLQVLGRQVEEVAEPGRDTLEVPDVGDRSGQLDVAHPLAADLGPGDLHATALADDALEPDALVLPAVALPVPGGAEDLLAEEPVLLRLERAVVDRLGLLDLAVGPRPDLLGRGQADPELIKVVDVEH